MWNQKIPTNLSTLLGRHITEENKRLSNNSKNLYKNVIIKKVVNKKMPIGGTFFTLFLLLFSTLAIFALSSDLCMKTALAMHEFREGESTRNLQDSSNDQFGYSEISNGFGTEGGDNINSGVYENPDIGLSMPVPPDWQEAPPAEEIEGLEVQIRPSDRLDVYFAISVYGTEPGTTQEDLNEENLQLISEAGNKIVNSGSIGMAGGNIPAFFIEYENYETETKVTAVSALMNDNEYYIEFGGFPATYDKFLSIAEELVNSIDIQEYGEGGDRDAGNSDFDQGQGQGFGQDQGQGFGQNEGFGQGNSGQFGQQGFEGNGSNRDLLEYSNPSLGFRIAYPFQSEVSEEPNNVTIETDLGLARVSVVTDVGIALDRYSDSRIGEIREGAEGFHVISSEESTLSGNPAHSLAYSTEENGTMLRAFALWTVSDNTAYNLVFIAPISAFESFVPVVENMIASFEVAPAGEGGFAGETEQTENNGSGSGFRS
jgi:hypothetical protein